MITERGRILRIIRDKSLLSIWEVCHHMAAFLTVRTVGTIRLHWTIHNKDMYPVEVKDHHNRVVFSDIGDNRNQVDWCLEYDAPYKQYTLYKNSSPRFTCSKESPNYLLTFLRLCINMVARCSTSDMSSRDLSFIGQQAVRKYEQYSNVMKYFSIPTEQIISLLTYFLGCVGTLNMTITWSHFRVLFKVNSPNHCTIYLINQGSHNQMNKSWECSSIQDMHQCYHDVKQTITNDTQSPSFIHSKKFVEKCIEGLNQNFKFIQVANQINSEPSSSYEYHENEMAKPEDSSSDTEIEEDLQEKLVTQEIEHQEYHENVQLQEENPINLQKAPSVHQENVQLQEEVQVIEKYIQEIQQIDIDKYIQQPNSQEIQQQPKEVSHSNSQEIQQPNEAPHSSLQELKEVSHPNSQEIQQSKEISNPSLQEPKEVSDPNLQEIQEPEEVSDSSFQEIQPNTIIRNEPRKRKRLLRSKGAPPSVNHEPFSNQVVEEKDQDQDIPSLSIPPSVDQSDDENKSNRMKCKPVSIERRRSTRIQSHKSIEHETPSLFDTREMDEWNDPKLNRLRRGLPIHYQHRHYKRRR